MKKRLVQCVGLTAMLMIAPSMAAAEQALSLFIAVPKLNGERRIDYSRDGWTFPVIIRNDSNELQRVWVDWYLWGYAALSFEITDDEGRVRTVRKKPRGFGKNIPQYWMLSSGEQLVLNVDFSSGEWEDFSFLGFEESTPGKMRVRMKAVFEVLPDEFSDIHQVWVGKVFSEENEYVFYNW